MSDTKKTVESIIDRAETQGQKDKYTAVNPSSGAYGRYQLIPSFHREAIQKKYGIPFEEIGNRPDVQDDYFSSILYPRYEKSALELKEKYPETNLTQEELIALQQLGKKNVDRYLSNKASENLIKQVDHYRKKAEEERFSKTKNSLSKTRIPADTKKGVAP